MSRGFLGTRAGLPADINLLLQIAMLTALSYAVIRSKQGKGPHCQVMPVLLVLNAAMIVAIMNPAFFRALPAALRTPTRPKPLVMWPHALLGGISELLGIYITIAAQSDNIRRERFATLKPLMRITAILWSASLVLGIVLYFVWYT